MATKIKNKGNGKSKGKSQSGSQGAQTSIQDVIKNLYANIQILDSNLQKLDGSQKNMAAMVSSNNAHIAVMARIFMRYMNLIIEKTNNLGGEQIESLSLDEFGDVFQEWAKFSQRPDSDKLWDEWTSGVRYEDLPEPPAVELEGIAAPSPQGGDYAEATMFGGDYEEGNAVEERSASEGKARDEVPEVQGSDGEEDQPADG